MKSSIFVLGAATFAVAAPAYAEASESDAAGESDRTIIVTGQHASSEAKRRADATPGGTDVVTHEDYACLLYTSPSPRDRTRSRMPSSA